MEDNYASPWRRIIAFLIDGLLVTLILNVSVLRPNVVPGLINTRLLLIIAVFVAYEALMIYYRGSTVGKWAMGIMIADHATQGKPSLLQCFVRPWARLFFGLGIINSIFIGFLSLVFYGLNLVRMVADEERRAIHDKASGTIALSVNR